MALFELSQSSEGERQGNGNRGSEGGRIRFLLGKSREEGGQLVPDPGGFQARGATAALSLAWI